MIEQLNRLQLDWELVEAIDAQSLTDQQIASHCAPMSTEMRQRYLTRGAIGCALSHIKALQIILMRGYERACILEDDLLLPEDFPSILTEMETLVAQSEVILLYWLSFEKQTFDRQTALHLKCGQVLASSGNADRLLSAVGYVVSANSAAKISNPINQFVSLPTVGDIFCRWGQLTGSVALCHLRFNWLQVHRIFSCAPVG
jgi:glycosyl transferase family 25